MKKRVEKRLKKAIRKSGRMASSRYFFAVLVFIILATLTFANMS